MIVTSIGTDVFKALALGAKCVFIGRPVLYGKYFYEIVSLSTKIKFHVVSGLAVEGQTGVENVLKILQDELDTAMALAGVNNISEIDEKYVVDKTTFHLSKL